MTGYNPPPEKTESGQNLGGSLYPDKSQNFTKEIIYANLFIKKAYSKYSRINSTIQITLKDIYFNSECTLWLQTGTAKYVFLQEILPG